MLRRGAALSNEPKGTSGAQAEGRLEPGWRAQQRSGDTVGGRGAVGAINEGALSVLQISARPNSICPESWGSVSARTIFERAFHGAKQAKVDEREGPNPTGRASDEPSRAAANSATLAGDSGDPTANADDELIRPIANHKIAGRMAHIALPHWSQIDESNVAPT
jgi:hypothetical protein